MMRFLFSLFLVLYFQCSHAQVRLDSIKQFYANRTPIERAIAYLDIARANQAHDDATSFKLCNEAVRISIELHNDTLQAKGLTLKAYTCYLLGDYENTLQCYLEAITLCTKSKFYIGKANALNELGVFYRKQKKIEAANASFQEAYELGQKEQKTSIMATAINNLGVSAQDVGKHKEAIALFMRAKAMYETSKDTLGISYVLDYASVSFAGLEQYNDAITYQLKSLELRSILKDSNAIALSYINLGEYENLVSHTERAKNYIFRCLQIGEKIKYKELNSYCYKLLSEIYAKEHDYEKAYTYHLKYSTLNEELFNENSSKQINELQTKYETEQKIQAIKLLTQENELKETRNRNQRYFLLGLLVLVMASSLAYYNFFKRKKQKEIDASIIFEKQERNKAIIQAEEKERTRIARDLHDGIAQTMTAAKMQLEYFIEESKTNQAAFPSLQNAFDLMKDASKEVRAVSHSMVPNALLKSGLVSAIRDFAHRLSNDKLTIHLDFHGLEQRLDEQIETVLFRILQELINNIMKHAQATEITIQITRDLHELTLLVEDNGIGFDTQKMHDGIGLKNLESRVEFLNGTIVFDSTIGKGTTVIVELVLEN